MKKNREIRREALRRMKGGWFWRLVLGLVVVEGLTSLPCSLLARYHKSQGIVPLGDFYQQQLGAMRQGLEWTLPTPEAMRQMYWAGAFETFAAVVFGAICLFGVVCLSMKVCRQEKEGWFLQGLKGFCRPLSLTWLLLLQAFLQVLGFLCFVIPGVVLTYRYRLAWYLKGDHPDWGAVTCLRSSGSLMKGLKWQAFRLDVFFFLWIFLALIPFSVAIVYSFSAASPAASLVANLLMLLSYALVGVIFLWLLTSRTMFYLSAKESQGADDDLPRDD